MKNETKMFGSETEGTQDVWPVDAIFVTNQNLIPSKVYGRIKEEATVLSCLNCDWLIDDSRKNRQSSLLCKVLDIKAWAEHVVVAGYDFLLTVIWSSVHCP